MQGTAEHVLDRITAYLIDLGERIVAYLGQPDIIYQLLIIAALYIPAWFISTRLEPKLEERAREIKGKRGLLRVIVAFLRRLEWLFFSLLLGLAYLFTEAFGWPADNRLIYSAMLLSSTWLAVNVVSHVMRNRLLRRIFTWFAWGYVAATLLGISDDIVNVLDSTTIGLGPKYTLWFIVKALILFGVLLWASLVFGSFAERRINTIDELTPSLRVLMGKIVRIALIVLAIVIGLDMVDLNLTALTVFSGAIGVGLGFGLQKVVSNFISGIIILMDQSIKPGDTITLGETFGWIRELRARFVSVVTRDGREFLIPNEDFITTQVINWSFSDPFVRLDVEFGVSYDSDPHEVSELAIEAASSVARVAASRKTPVCWLTAFGDSSLNFVLRFWIDDPQKGLTNVRGQVMLALWDAFKERGIQIPFPHREVIMKTPVAVEMPQQPAPAGSSD